jgi:hypothetical protein
MKIICPLCTHPNNLQEKECSSCESALSIGFDSLFRTEKGKVISFLEVFSKVEQLEQRVAFVEENYEQKVLKKEPTKVVEPIEAVILPEPPPRLVIPQELPSSLEELSALLAKASAAKAAAYDSSDMALYAEWRAECKRIDLKIQSLKEAAEPEQAPLKEVVFETEKTYPTTIEALKILLVKTLEERLAANAANDLKAVEAFLEEERKIKQRIQNLELEARFGKNAEENKEELVLAESEVIQEHQETVPTESVSQPRTVKAEPQGPTPVEQFFAPLTNGIEFIKQRYNQYKEEGKLPLFFLTITGIVTLLFGFGFLAQYSAVTYFGDYLMQIKIGFGFVCSAAAIAIGIRLISKKADFAAFGQALMGLGLSLNYLFIYFLSVEPALISSTVGFVLIFVNTAISIGLSLKFNSKIIAFLALFGGAFAPSYLQSTGENTHIYFFYLWLLCVASAIVAYKIKWEVLNFISFLVATLILGSSVYFNYTNVRTLSDNMYLSLFHAFAYLYAYLSLFNGLKPKSEQSPMSLITIVGAQLAMMMSLYYVFGLQQISYGRLAIAYLVNMLPFIAITLVYWNHWSKNQKSLLMGLSGAFLAAAIGAYVGAAYQGMLWALEGILLLAAGMLFQLALVRRIAYFVIAISIISMLNNLGWDNLPDRIVGALFTTGYINLWSVGITLLSCSILFKKYEDRLDPPEKSISLVFNEVIAIWGISMFYITTLFFVGQYVYNFALITMVVLLLWNNYQKLQLAEILGIGQILVLVVPIAYSMNQAQSWHFSNLALYAQLALIEIIMVLWGLTIFYKKVFPNAAEYKHTLAEKAREVSYFILPIALLDAFNHGLPTYILYGLWLMVLLTFVLSKISGSKLVLVEFLLLAVVAMGVSFIEIQYGALLFGNILLFSILFFEKGWQEEAFEKPDYQLIYLAAPYFAIASVGLIIYKETNGDLISALFVGGSLLLTLVNLGHRLAPIKRTLDIAYRAAWGLTAIALAILCFILKNNGLAPNIFILAPSIPVGFVFLAISLGWSHKMIYKADIPYNGDQQSAVWIGESIFLHLLNVASYSSFLFYMTGDFGSLWVTIALFVHGIALVFNGLLPNYKQLSKVYIAIFVIAIAKLFFMDMRDSETVMKIVVFIVLGIIFLVSAFALIKYQEKKK